MNIQYIKTNIAKMSQHELTSLLADMILDNAYRLEDFDPSRVYRFGARVYFEDNGTHYAYECIENGATGPFDKTKWIPLVEVYRGPSPTFYTLRIREEVHVITSATTKQYTMKLDFDVESSSIAIYRGMQRLAYGVDFEMDKTKKITFKTTMNVNERIIIEVRERLGVIPNIIAGIVLYDINNNPYNVLIDDSGKVTVVAIEKKDDVRDIKRATLVLGDKRYTLMIDSGLVPPALGLFEEVKQYIKTTNGKIYSITVTGNKMDVIEEPFIDDGIEYIMGTDKKFYKFNVSGNTLAAVQYTDSVLKPEDYNVGFRLKSTDYKDKMIDVRNGVVRLIDYLPNTAYRNIMLRDKGNSKVYRITLTRDLYLQMHDDTVGTGTHSPIMDDLYFYDYNLNNLKLYVKNDKLIYESTAEVTVRDSRGINMINEDGVLSKMLVLANDKVDTILFADLSKAGTFAAPLENGIVVMDGSTKKMISVNLNGDTLVVNNAPADAVFKTNAHYIFGSDNKLYKLTYANGSVGVAICDPNDFVMENQRSKVVMRSNDSINIIDVKNNAINITPVSTFTHTLKSNNGQKFLLDVNGERGREVVTLNQINAGHPYYSTVGLGCLYLKNTSGQYYKGTVNNGALTFTTTEQDSLIDYNVTSVANTSKGWYKFELIGSTLGLRKIFNNMYYPSLSYEVSRDFVLSSENDVDFSLTVDGNGDLGISPVEDKGIKGVFLRSNDDRCYCMGVVNNAVGTYRSYVEKSVEVEKVIYIRDILTGRFNALYMKEDKLVMEIISMAPSTAVRELLVYNEYGDEFHVIACNGKLMLVEDMLDRVVDESGRPYIAKIVKRRLVFEIDGDGTTEGLNVGIVKLTDMVSGIHYNYRVKNGILVGEPTTTAPLTPTQSIKTEDGLYVLSLFDGRISMTLITEDVRAYDIDKEYIPMHLESEKVYDGIRLYRDIMNSEGYVMVNRFDLDGDKLVDVDEDSERFAYQLPTLTTSRPKVNMITDENIKFK